MMRPVRRMARRVIDPTLLLGLLSFTCSCQDGPGTVKLRICWERPPEAVVWLWIRVEEREDKSMPGSILRSVNAIEYDHDAPPVVTLDSVPNGEKRVVVVEVRDGKNTDLAIRYYGVSEPFSLKPGRNIEVETSLSMIAPQVQVPGGTPVVEILVGGISKDFVRREELDKVSVRTWSRAASLVVLANDISFSTGRVELALDGTSGLDCRDESLDDGVFQVCDLPWDLSSGLYESPDSAPDGLYSVSARFFDEYGYPSSTFIDTVEFDSVVPALLGIPVFMRLDGYERAHVGSNEVHASSGSTVRVQFALTEPVRHPPVVMAQGVSLEASLTQETGAWYSVDLDDIGIKGLAAVLVEVTDHAGNEASLNLGHIHYDYQAPSPLTSDQLDFIRLFRAPWGCSGTAGAAATELRICRNTSAGGETWSWCPEEASSPFGESALVTFYEGNISASGFPFCTQEPITTVEGLGWGANQHALLDGGWPTVCYTSTDLAGNESEPQWVEWVEWVATMGGDTVGEIKTNPHRTELVTAMRTTLTQDHPASQSQGDVAKALDRLDGTSVLVESRPWAWERLTFTGENPSAREVSAVAFDPTRGKLVLFGGEEQDNGYSPLGDTWEWDGRRWLQRTTWTPGPPSRTAHALAYDGANGTILLFGGFDASGGLLCDTWQWDGEQWSEVLPSGPSPGPRAGHRMVYDRQRRRIVLNGGIGPGLTYFSDTWEWDGTAWEKRAPQLPGLPIGGGHELVYDSARCTTVLFGGSVQTDDGWDETDQTWLYDGDSWKLVTGLESEPSRRYSHRMAYDAERELVVLFGGVVGDSTLGDLWEWDGSSWHEYFPGDSVWPAARYGHEMAFDTVRRRVVLHGGNCNNCDTPLTDTWEWSGPELGWSERTPAASYPSPRSFHGVAYDVGRSCTVVFGGLESQWVTAPITWEWNGARWTKASVTTYNNAYHWGHCMCYDTLRDRTVFYGGYDASMEDWAQGSTMEWDGTAWHFILSGGFGCPHGGFCTMAYDDAQQNCVLFGGEFWDWEVPEGPASETWTFDGEDWAWEADGSDGPQNGFGAAMVYDTARGRSVLFGGEGVSNETWEWDGTAWEQMQLITEGPEPSSHAGFVYDGGRGRAIMFGGKADDGVDLGQFWEWDGQVWTPVSPPGDTPKPRYGHSLTYDAREGRLTLFGGNGIAAPEMMWEWNVGDEIYPAALFHVDLANAFADASFVRGLEVLTEAGGSGYSRDLDPFDDSDIIGDPLPGVDLLGWNVQGGEWEEVESCEASPDASGWLEFVEDIPDEALGWFMGPDGWLHFAVRPSAGAGNGPGPATLAVDYFEVRITSRLPSNACQAECVGKECGDDGCGGVCGTCPFPGDVCQDGQCCTSQCEEKQCGSDGCGGLCGQCVECGTSCQEGICVFTACDGRECGPDGCGGSCGGCEIGWMCFDMLIWSICGDLCEDVPLKGCCLDGNVHICYSDQWNDWYSPMIMDCSNFPECGWNPTKSQYDCGMNGEADPSGEWPKKCPFQ